MKTHNNLFIVTFPQLRYLAFFVGCILAFAVFSPILTPSHSQSTNGWPVQVSYVDQGITYYPSVDAGPYVGDIDADGYPEAVVIGGGFPVVVSVYRHDGSLHPGWPRMIDIGKGFDPGVLLGDMDGDGRLEIIAVAGSSIYIWKENGELMPGWPQPGPSFFAGRGYCSLGDLDSDGSLDIFFTQSNWDSSIGKLVYDIYALDNKGNNLPGWPVRISGVNNAMLGTPSILVDDVNPDGYNELIFAFGNSNTSVAEMVIFSDRGSILYKWPFPMKEKYASSFVMGDIDNDGIREIIIAGGNHIAQPANLYAFKADGTIVPGWPYHLWKGSGQISLADLGHDGCVDIIVATDDNTMTSTLGTKNQIDIIDCHGNTLPGWPINFAENSQGVTNHAIVGDVDGDGSEEIILKEIESIKEESGVSANYVNVYAWKIDGTLVNGYPFTLGKHTVVGQIAVPVLTDLNQDGRVDMLLLRPEFVGNFDTTTSAGYASLINVLPQAGTYDAKNMSWPMERHDTYRSGKLPTTATKQEYCGDGIIQSHLGEVCDSTSGTCLTNQGYLGTQACNAACSGFDNCVGTEFCGDGLKNGTEECDGLAGVGQHQECSASCTLVNLPYCGDGILNGTEQCDGLAGVGEHQECSAECALIDLPSDPQFVVLTKTHKVYTGSNVTFNVVAQDANGYNLELQALEALPKNAAFTADTTTFASDGSSSIDGTFSWTPSTRQVGTYSLHFEAGDAGGSASTVSDPVTIEVVKPTTTGGGKKR